MFIAIEEVRRGDIIVEGRDETKVTKVEPFYCSSNGTHINNRSCYDRGSIVKVKRDQKEPSFDESGLGDFEEDFDMGILLTLGDSNFSDKTLKRNLATQGTK